MAAINVGSLIARRDEIKNILDNQAALRRELTVINQLIVLTDPAKADPDMATHTNGRRPRHKQEPGVKCMVPGCNRLADFYERCKPHYQRWIKSEEYRDLKGSVKCEICPPEAGPWTKSQQGMVMHLARAHGIKAKDQK